MITILKNIDNFIENTIAGCKFVGMGDDGELLIKFQYQDDSLRLNAADLLRGEFPEIKKVTFVETVTVAQAKQMMDDLTGLLQKLAEEEKPKQLLDIKNF